MAYNDPLVIEDKRSSHGSLVGGLVGSKAPPAGPIDPWSDGGDWSKPPPASKGGGGDGWTGPGVQAPPDKDNYTPGAGWSKAGQQAPVGAWNFTPPPGLGMNTPPPGLGLNTAPDTDPPPGPPVGPRTLADIAEMDPGYQYADPVLRQLGGDAAEQRYWAAAKAIYDNNPHIAKHYDNVAEFKDAPWYTRMKDWIPKAIELNDYGRDAAGLVKYAKTYGWYEDSPEWAARENPVTPGYIWVRPRTSGNILEVMARYGLERPEKK